MNKPLLLRTRHLVLDSELQCGPGSRRARSTVPSTYAKNFQNKMQRRFGKNQDLRLALLAYPILKISWVSFLINDPRCLWKVGHKLMDTLTWLTLLYPLQRFPSKQEPC